MAVEFIIDTNRYRDFVDGDTQVVNAFGRAATIYLPVVVVAELRAGFALGTRGAENQKVFERFLNRPRVDVLFPTLGTTRQYATLYRQLRVAGTPIPTNDLWIAAIVLEHDIPLYTRDGHFKNIPQLPLFERRQ